MLEAVNLSYNHAIQEVTCSFDRGQLHALLGPNGAGKSTFLKILCGILKPTKGSVCWLKQDLAALSRPDMSRLITLVPQNPPLVFDYRVEEFVAMGRYVHSSSQGIAEALERVNALPFLKRPLNQLSQGERQRIYVARALATEAAVILFDEPTAHMDFKSQREIWLLMKELAREGKTVLVANHDLKQSEQFCDTALLLDRGYAISFGKWEPLSIKALFGL